jgi:hypothetical protein
MEQQASVINVAESAGVGRFIPREVLERHARRDDRPRLNWNDFLWSLIEKVDSADVSAENLRHRKWLTCLQYHAGEQGGFVGFDGDWVNLPVNPWDSEYDPENNIYVVNLVRYFVRSLLKDYSRSQVMVDVKTASSRFEKRAAAKVAQALARHVQQGQLSPYKMLRDAKFTIICGNSFRYTVCDATAGGYHKEPVMERVSLRIGAAWRCSKCYQMGSAPEFGAGDIDGAGQGVGDAMEAGALSPDSLQQQCPDCGGQMVYAGGGETEVERPSGKFDMKARPDIQTVIVDPFEMKLPLSSPDLFVAPWLRRQRYVEKNRLELAYQWAEISGGGGQGGDSGLNAQRQRQTSAGNVNGTVNGVGSQDGDFEKFRQYWFRPEEYAHYIFEMDDRFANGETIQAGTRAIDLFPRGMYVAVAGGAIVDLADEDKARHWTHNRWEIEPSSPWASGIEDMVVNNATRNEVFSLLMESIAYHTAPPILLDGQVWDRDDWTGKPGQVAVSSRTLAQGRDIGGTYAMPPARSAGGDVWNFLESAKADMQLTSGGAFSTTSGLPDVHTETAEGMAIQRDESLSFFGPQFSAKAETDVATVKQAVVLVKDYGLTGDYFERLSDLSEIETEAFEEADVELDFIFEQRRGSEIPRSALEMRNNWTQAMQMGLYSDPTMPPVIRRHLSDAMGLPYGTELFAADERNTWLRIWTLRQLAEKLEQPLGEEGAQLLRENPQALQELMATALPLAQEMAPVRPRYDDHAVSIEVITEFMKTDEGRGLSMLGEILINDLYERHLMAMQQQAAEQGMMANGMMAASGALATNAQGSQGAGKQVGATDSPAGMSQGMGMAA